MNAVTTSKLRKNIGQYFDQVYDNKEVLIIPRPEGKNVVILSVDQYNMMEMDETAYLMSSPANAKRLLSAMEELKKVKGLAKELIEV
jgi:antitoxin YefM